jgi:hypothetical protein
LRLAEYLQVGRFERFGFEQHLSRREATISSRMTEILRLREMVRSAERRLGIPSSLQSETDGASCQILSAHRAAAGYCHVLATFLTVDPDCEILLPPQI